MAVVVTFWRVQTRASNRLSPDSASPPAAAPAELIWAVPELEALAFPLSFSLVFELEAVLGPTRLLEDEAPWEWFEGALDRFGAEVGGAGGRPHDLSVGEREAFSMWNVCWKLCVRSDVRGKNRIGNKINKWKERKYPPPSMPAVISVPVTCTASDVQ